MKSNQDNHTSKAYPNLTIFQKPNILKMERTSLTIN